ncbi:hypothetical protein [Lysinibacillus sp. NPDC093688]|uniref:hypothetical protein n=1 Tax=Lysinibacillus sp. NPDC093688 TaxID=3390577 RepID=UPI003D01031E
MSVADEARNIQLGFEGLASNREETVRQTGLNIITDNHTLNTVNFISIITVSLIAIGIALYSATSISRPVRRITERDLSDDALTVQSKDEIGQLIGATNILSEKLQSMLRQIQVSLLLSGCSVAKQDNTVQQSEEKSYVPYEIIDGYI